MYFTYKNFYFISLLTLICRYAIIGCIKCTNLNSTNDNIEITFGCTKRIIARHELQQFSFLQDVLDKNKEKIEFPEVNVDHFLRIMALRSEEGYLRGNEYTFEYFLDQKFIDLYKMLTKTEGNAKVELIKEIESGLKKLGEDRTQLYYPQFKSYLTEHDSIFNVNHFYVTSLFIPVILKHENTSLYIKYDFPGEIESITSFPNIKGIHIKIWNNTVRQDRKIFNTKTRDFFYKIIEKIQLYHQEVPIHVITWAAVDGFGDLYSDFNFRVDMKNFMESKKYELRIFNSIGRPKIQHNKRVKYIGCLKYTLLELNNSGEREIDNIKCMCDFVNLTFFSFNEDF